MKLRHVFIKTIFIVLIVFGAVGAIAVDDMFGRIFFAVVAGAGAAGLALVSRKYSTAEKPNSKIYKKWWFWLIVVLVLLAVIGSQVGDESQPQVDEPQSSQSEQSEQEELSPPDKSGDDDSAETPTPEEIKEAAISNDLIIYAAVTQAQRYYDVLTTTLKGLDTGEADLLEVYSTCEDMQNYLSQFSAHVDEATDESAIDYKDKAHGYIGNIRLIASDIMDFIDSQDVEALSDANEGITLMPEYQRRVDEARTEYLYQAGLTDAEIAEIVQPIEDPQDEAGPSDMSGESPPAEAPETAIEETPQEPENQETTEMPATAEPSDAAYVGSVDSDKYHYPSCRFAENILPENLIEFASRETAEAAGYIPCGVCKP